MNKLPKYFLEIISFQPLLVELGLENQPIEFQKEFIEEISKKVEGLFFLKISSLMDEHDFAHLNTLTDADEIKNFLEEKNIDLDEILSSVTDFIADYLSDYRDGINNFIKNING